MPLVEVTLTEGRTPEQLRALITGLTRAVHETIDAPVANVRVIVREVPGTHFAAGDVTIAERNAAAAADAPPHVIDASTRHTESAAAQAESQGEVSL